MAARGVFITFEGGDGSGKSTQIQSVRDWFESRGREVIVTREPGGTELGTEIRRLVQNGPEDVDARTEALLYAADRAYHVATVIGPPSNAARSSWGTATSTRPWRIRARPAPSASTRSRP